MLPLLAFLLATWLMYQVVRVADAFERMDWHERTAESRLAMYCGRNPYAVDLPSSRWVHPELQLAGAVV